MGQTINVSNKAEVKEAISYTSGRYNLFEGDIRKGNRSVHIGYVLSQRVKLIILVTYWEDSQMSEVEVNKASGCTTVNDAIDKVSKFLNIK